MAEDTVIIKKISLQEESQEIPSLDGFEFPEDSNLQEKNNTGEIQSRPGADDPAIIITKPGKTMKIIDKKKEYRRSLISQYHAMTCSTCGCEFLVKHRVYKDRIFHCPNDTCATHIIVGNRCIIL